MTHYIQLLSRSAVEQLLDAGPEFPAFLDRFAVPQGPVRRFPNGAVEVDMGRVDEDEWREALISCASPGCGLGGSSVYPPLGPFTPVGTPDSKRWYYVCYPMSYQVKLKSEQSLLIGRGQVRPPDPGEFELARLEITVLFRTRMSKGVRKAFAYAVASWGRDAARRGAFEDGPVALLPPGIEFNGVRSRLYLDARLSGQDTLNWLSLIILDFGEDVHTVTNIFFGASAEVIDSWTGPLGGKVEVVDFPAEMSPATPEEPVVTAPVTHVPPNAKPESNFRSRTFPVLVLPVDEWDSFRATIYFGRPLRGEERDRLAALIRAWARLGTYGGFGGVGAHSTDEVAFDGVTDSAFFEADMGDVDPEIALPVLIRTLEGFELHGAPIDALVFGHSGWGNELEG